jgi:hypothetical protein
MNMDARDALDQRVPIDWTSHFSFLPLVSLLVCSFPLLQRLEPNLPSHHHYAQEPGGFSQNPSIVV